MAALTTIQKTLIEHVMPRRDYVGRPTPRFEWTGIAGVEGEFAKGEVVSLVDHSTNEEFARGLSNYDSAAVRSIAGHRRDEIARILGVDSAA